MSYKSSSIESTNSSAKNNSPGKKYVNASVNTSPIQSNFGFSTSTIINVMRRDDNSNINTGYDMLSEYSFASNSSSQHQYRKESIRIDELCQQFQGIPLDLSGLHDSGMPKPSTAQTKCQNDHSSHTTLDKTSKTVIDNHHHKVRCKTNAYKAIKSFEKNHPSSPPTNVSPQQIKQFICKLKELPTYKCLKSTDGCPSKVKKRKPSVEPDDNNNSSIEETSTKRTSIASSKRESSEASTSRRVPRLDLHLLYRRSNCASTSAFSTDNRPLNPQEVYKLKVPKPVNQYEYLCRTCRLYHIRKPTGDNPLLVLDFDSLLYQPTLSYQHGISRFFDTICPTFDIGIWSSVNMKILMDRLKNLNILVDENSTKICFCLDATSTIKAFLPNFGKAMVKPLQIIWNLYPEYNEKNTILLDIELKRLLFNRYGVPISTQLEERVIHFSELIIITNFLISYAASRRPFSKLNQQVWKKNWN